MYKDEIDLIKTTIENLKIKTTDQNQLIDALYAIKVLIINLVNQIKAYELAKIQMEQAINQQSSGFKQSPVYRSERAKNQYRADEERVSQQIEAWEREIDQKRYRLIENTEKFKIILTIINDITTIKPALSHIGKLIDVVSRVSNYEPHQWFLCRILFAEPQKFYKRLPEMAKILEDKQLTSDKIAGAFYQATFAEPSYIKKRDAQRILDSKSFHNNFIGHLMKFQSQQE